MTNRYLRRTRISEVVFRRFLRHAAADLTAGQIAMLTGPSRNTVNRLLALPRLRMAAACEAASPFCGEVKVDESYFGPRRVKGKRGRGAGRKTIVFGIFKRGRGYDGLVDLGYARHLRVNHDANQFADAVLPGNHINGTESFWGYAKRRLAKFNGIRGDTFYLHLKESEYRFNHRRGNLYAVLLAVLKNAPL